MSAFKILVTSQKGGVGKSTLSANLAAFLQRQGQAVTLIDFDTHGSSSTWLKRAPNIGLVIQHQLLPLSHGGSRPVMDARLHLRRAANSSDVVVCDLTWTDGIGGELMFEYDLVIVPTSVSEIELAATAGFLNRHRWVFDSAIRPPPTLLLTPTRLRQEQLQSDCFSKQRFAVSFMLAPPVLESQGARDMFEHGYLMDLQDDCGQSFVQFGQAVLTAREMLNATGRAPSAPTSALNEAPSPPPITAADNPTRLRMVTDLSSHCSVLGRHRMEKTRDTESTGQTVGSISLASISLPQFLKRFKSSTVEPS